MEDDRGQTGPVEQMEAILREESLKLAAEQTKMHAEAILLTAMHQRPMTQGHLLYKASGQGLDYLTGVTVAIALVTRNWGRVFADDATLELEKYLEEEVECDAPMAHDLVRQALTVRTVPDADVIREDLRRFAERYGPHQLGRVLVHFTYLCAELLLAVLDVVESKLEEAHQGEGGGDS